MDDCVRKGEEGEVKEVKKKRKKLGEWLEVDKLIAENLAGPEGGLHVPRRGEL